MMTPDMPALLTALVLGRLGWLEAGAILGTGVVLYGYLALAVSVLAVERPSLVEAALRSRFRLLMNVLGAIASPAVILAPYLLPAGLLLAIIGLFARWPWRLLAIADLVLLVPLVAVFARFGAPMLLDHD